MDVMSAFSEATRVGAEVRPEVVETEESDKGSLCEMSRGERGSAGAGAEELPEQVRAGPRTW